jgi:S-formylglutathione hydrolase FrmB
VSAVASAQCDDFEWSTEMRTYPAGVEHHTFHSDSMDADVGFNIYLPPSYAASTESFPVLYYLHGIGGDENVMVQNVVSWYVDRFERGLVREMVIVFPNGFTDAFYADAFDGSRMLETSILRELVPHVESNWRAGGCRGQRAISGFSMGGFGASLYAMKHPDLFSSLVVYAGALLDWETINMRHPQTVACMYDDQRARYDEFSPWHWVTMNRDAIAGALPIRIAAGDADGVYPYNVAMHERLDALGIAHEWSSVPGCGHAHGCLFDAVGDDGVRLQERSFAACGTPERDGGMVVPTSDAGAGDAGSATRTDGGTRDAGTTMVAAGCGCRTGAKSPPSIALLASVSIMLVRSFRWRIDRRARCTRARCGNTPRSSQKIR